MTFHKFLDYRNNSPVAILIAALIGVSAGCADENWGYVTGTVSLQGKPVGPGSMMFEPENPPTMTTPSAIAHFREDGKYSLKSAGNREGAPIGTYLVMIHGRSEESFGDEIVDPNHKSAIPGKYLNHRLSGLKATVKPGSQTIDFDLEP
ncbi:MAG: hypothetical protein WD851_13420 [Pirellulales bacterium]